MSKTIIKISFFVWALTMCGCKGRTIDNVEPTGDTIEVIINNNSATPLSDSDFATMAASEEESSESSIVKESRVEVTE